MKNALVLVLMILTVIPALATTYDQFDCQTATVIEGKSPTTIHFIVKNVDSKKPALEAMKDDSEPIQMIPADSVLDLNDNWTFNVGPEKLEITSDGDGCQWTSLILYENTKFLSGFVQVKGDKGCGSGDFYSKLSCKRSPVQKN